MNEKQEQNAVISEELLRRAQQGDQGALTSLYEQTHQDVYRAIHAMVRDEELVLDIQQDTYLRAFERLDQLKKPESFSAWLRKIAVNEAKNQLSRKKPLLFSELGDPDEDASELEIPDCSMLPEDALDRAETARMVDDILKTLTPEQQLVVGMYYYEQIPAREIADNLGVSAGTVHSQLHWGRKKIEAAVRALEKKGVKLYGLSPLPFLLGLLRSCRPTEKEGSRVAAEILRRSAKPAASVGIKVGRRFFETVIGKLVLGLLAVGMVGGGAIGVRALARLNQNPPVGDFQPPAVETAPLPTEPVVTLPTEPRMSAETTEPPVETTEPPTEPTEAPTEATEPEETQPEKKNDDPKPTEKPLESTPKPTEAEKPAENTPQPTDPPEESQPEESQPVEYTPRTTLRDYSIPDSLYVGWWGYFEVFLYGESEPKLYTDHPEILSIEAKGRFYDNPYGKDKDTIYNGVYNGGARDWGWYVTALSTGEANVYCTLNGETTLLKTVTVSEN